MKIALKSGRLSAINVMEEQDFESAEETEDEEENYELPQEVVEYLAKSGFTIVQYLGSGAYSNVFKVKFGAHLFAIKVIELAKQPNNVINKYLPREMSIASNIRHPYIMVTHHILNLNDRFVFFVSDFADGGDLITILEKDTELDVTIAKKWFSQIVEAVVYLHSRGIAHRDIKPDNILIDKKTAKLTDFGYARLSIDANGNVLMTESFCGTYEYQSPEAIIREEPYDPIISDCFSLGTLLFLMITLEFPFGSGKRIRTDTGLKKFVRKQMRQEWQLTQNHKNDRNLYSLLRQLLNPDVSARIRSKQILSHPWFDTN